MILPATVTLLSLAALLAAERTGFRPGVFVAKPLASTEFVWAGIAAGGLDAARAGDHYAIWLLVGLVLSWWGDVLLIPRERPAVFRIGVLAFLLGHVAFVVAFAGRGLDPIGSLVAALALLPPVVIVLRWLAPSVPAELALAVRAYVIVITTMVVCAVGTVVYAGASSSGRSCTRFSRYCWKALRTKT